MIVLKNLGLIDIILCCILGKVVFVQCFRENNNAGKDVE